jgi:hypothetical protein
MRAADSVRAGWMGVAQHCQERVQCLTPASHSLFPPPLPSPPVRSLHRLANARPSKCDQTQCARQHLRCARLLAPRSSWIVHVLMYACTSFYRRVLVRPLSFAIDPFRQATHGAHLRIRVTTEHHHHLQKPFAFGGLANHLGAILSKADFQAT